MSPWGGCGLSGRTGGPAYVEVACPTFEAKFLVLDDLATFYAAHSPAVRELAAEVDRQGRTTRALHQVLRRRLRFRPEEDETYRSPDETLALGGDCDDHVLAGLAVARRLGLPARMVGRPGQRNREGHVALQLGEGGAWFWAETTVDAAWGEPPDDAAARLGHDRPDLSTGAPFALQLRPETVRAVVGVETTDAASATVVDPTGPVGRRTYGEICAYLYASATARPDLRASLSAASLAYASIREGQLEGADAVLRGQIEGVQAQLTDLIDTLASNAYVDVAQEVVGAIPVLGTLVNIAIDIGEAVGISSGPDTTDAERLSECIGRVVAPTPSGVGGRVMPADLVQPTCTVGRYLAFFEIDPSSRPDPMEPTWADYAARRSLLKVGQYPGKSQGVEGQRRALRLWLDRRGSMETAIENLYLWDIPADVRELLRLCRLAIGSQHRPPVTAAAYAGGARAERVGTGGSELWPLYCDLLQSQVDAARVSWPMFRAVATAEDSCAPWTSAAEAPIRLLNAYAASRAPQYADPVVDATDRGEVREEAALAMVRAAGGGAGGPFLNLRSLTAPKPSAAETIGMLAGLATLAGAGVALARYLGKKRR